LIQYPSGKNIRAKYSRKGKLQDEKGHCTQANGPNEKLWQGRKRPRKKIGFLEVLSKRAPGARQEEEQRSESIGEPRPEKRRGVKQRCGRQGNRAGGEKHGPWPADGRKPA